MTRRDVSAACAPAQWEEGPAPRRVLRSHMTSPALRPPQPTGRSCAPPRAALALGVDDPPPKRSLPSVRPVAVTALHRARAAPASATH